MVDKSYKYVNSLSESRHESDDHNDPFNAVVTYKNKLKCTQDNSDDIYIYVYLY